MSANKKRRSSSIIIHSNSNQLQQQRQQQQMAALKDMSIGCDMTQQKGGQGEGEEIKKNDLFEMPRVCRCCCKGNMELLSLFEAGDEMTNSNSATTNTSAQRRKLIATTENMLRHEQQQQRKSDNPVEYALSGAHSNMDTVREEMILWMLNVSKLFLPLITILLAFAQFKQLRFFTISFPLLNVS